MSFLNFSIVEAVLFLLFVFGWHIFLRDRLSQMVIDSTNIGSHLPHRVNHLIMRIPFYGIPGLVGYALYLIASPDSIILPGYRTEFLLSGLALGFGMLACASVLANALYVAFHQIKYGPEKLPWAKADLRVAKDSGWIKTYTLAFKHLPVWGFLLVTSLAVIGEELAFRGVLLPLLAEAFGPNVAVFGSVLAFCLIQIPFMPSLYAAIIPVCGAFVVGVVLGYLALATGSLFLCIVGHLGYLLFTIVIFLAWDDPDIFRKQHPMSKSYR